MSVNNSPKFAYFEVVLKLAEITYYLTNRA